MSSENLIADYEIIKYVIAIQEYLGIVNDNRFYKRKTKIECY